MLSTVLTYIALIGSTLIAIDKIFTVLIKPRKWFKAREDERNQVKREGNRRNKKSNLNFPRVV